MLVEFSEEERQARREHLTRRLEARRQIFGFVIGVGILLAAFTAFFVLQQEAIQRTYMYPYYYRDVVEKYGSQYHVDPYLVAAVIKTESQFQPNVHSSHGAVGLMQLMPETAYWVSQQLEDKSYSLDNLHKPQNNIRYGTWYLASLLEEFHGNEILALAAYNAGRGNVVEWMEAYGWDYEFADVQSIPFTETREYVRSVIRFKEKYHSLYEK